MANNFTLQTQFNTSPYWDDYNPDKGFYRILFKPSMAVQSRELTQMQTMLQTQIDRFAEHVFKEGSLVSGGQFSIEVDIGYVKVKDLDSTSTQITISNFKGVTVTGQTSGVKAYVIDVADGSEIGTDPKTLFVRYLNAGTDGETKTFVDGEILTTSSVGSCSLLASNATGNASFFTIDAGVVFSKDHFIKFDRQQIILEKYSTDPSCKVGFNILETIVTATDDNTLNDPAQGSYNYAAPGADRLKLTAQLTKTTDDDPLAILPNFVELFIIKDGIVQEEFQRTQYSIIQNELAKRTFDESGDYFVAGLDVRIREHLDTGSNQGYLTANNGGNSALLSVGVEPGTAYVKGYEIGTLVTTYLTTDKSSDYEDVNNQIIRSRFGSFVYCDELVGSWDLNTPISVDLYDTAQNRISGKVWSTGSQTGTKVGTAKVKGIELESGTPSSSDAKYRVYLFDIQMANGPFTSVRSIYSDNSSTSDIGADVVLDSISNTAVLQDSTFSTLVYPVGSQFVRSIRDSSGNSDTTFAFKKSYAISIANTGTFTIDTGLSTEIFPYGTGFLTTAEKEELIVSLNDDASVTMAGTVSATANSTTVSGTNTHFDWLSEGDKIEISGLTGTYFVDTITSNVSMTLTSAAAATVSTKTFSKVYKEGDLLSFNVKGATTGTTRTVQATSSSTIEFDLKESLAASVTGTATMNLDKTTAKEIKKILRPSRYVKIDCSTAGTTGPFNLGFSDVYKIRQVRKSGSSFTSATDGSDVTENFFLDNGMRDEFYRHGTISPSGVSLANTDHLLVELDYFYSDYTQGVGYYSVDSYPVNDSTTSNTTITTAQIPIYKSPVSGQTYDLRNCLDFRPMWENTATDATTVAGASSNPSTTTSFNAPSGGIRLPKPAGEVTFDYSYYLARKDLVVLDSSGKFTVVRGIPGVVPVTPKTPPNTMAISTLTIAPFPSLAPAYALKLRRADLSTSVKKTAYVRYTMREIGVLKQRIENLETYTSLSLLEKQAKDLLVLDSDGLDRFKNGIFVDTFADHSLGATDNIDYKIVVDPVEKSIRPNFTMDSLMYNYTSGSNVQVSNNLITLPYTEVSLIDQPYATTYRNVENSIFRFEGQLVLDPANDVWVDVDRLPDQVINLDLGTTSTTVTSDSQIPDNASPLTTTWGAWQTAITGVSTSSKSEGGPSPLGAKGGGLYGTRTTTVTTKTTTTTSRSGVQTFVVTDGDYVQLGDRVVDVSLTPYIRPQMINVFAQGLKSSTRIFAYFDDEDVSSLITPCDEDFNSIGSEGSKWTTDENGIAYGIFRIPSDDSKTFRVGTKTLRVSDSPSNAEETTTSAQAAFVAQGLIEQKQNTILSTSHTTLYEKEVTESKKSTSTTSYKIKSQYKKPHVSGSCMGYSFLVSVPQEEEGIFLTHIDVFLADKSDTLGCWFEIREMDNASGITRNQVPYSEKWYTVDELTTSDDASVAHSIYFDCPVFLYNDTEYALLIHTVGINPDTYFWVCELGQEDISTGNKITSRALTGNLYTTNNNLDWDIVPNLDLKVKFYRAKFSTGVNGTAVFGNKPIETLIMDSVTAPFSNYGEKISGKELLTLSNVSGGTIAVTDLIVGANSGVSSAVANVNGTAVKTEGVGYANGESISVLYANSAAKGITATISSVTAPKGTLKSYKKKDGVITLKLIDTSGSFTVGETITGLTSNTSGVIDSLGVMNYSVVDFEPSYITFNNTGCSFDMKGTSNNGILDTSWTSVHPNDNTTFKSEKAVLGHTAEIADLSGASSSQIRATMNTQTNYVSPVLDLNRFHSVYVHNIVNANTVGETEASGGNCLNKYISKTVTLEDGQDAEDLLVKLTAYKPPGTDIKVYAKIKNAEDSDNFDSHPWIEMTNNSGTLSSSVADPNDFVELEYGFPDSVMTGDNGEVAYENSNGVTFATFIQYSIKICLTSTDSAKVPRAADLQTICLQL